MIMSGNTSQSQFISELLDRFFRGILSTKLDDQKILLNSIPLSGKLVLADSKVTYNEALFLFCRLERDYSSLNIFPSRSLFSRKADCLTLYNSLRAGFDSVCNNTTLSSNEVNFSVYMRIIAASRGQLITLYRKITEKPLLIITSCSSLISSATDILNQLSITENELTKAFTQILQLIKLEVIILRELFSAQVAISDLMFLESLLSLNRAKDSIDELNKMFNSQGVNSLSKQSPLVSWLECFYTHLFSKYTLYWFEILVRSASSVHEIEEISNSETPNLVASITKFQRESNALNISLLFDTTCQSFPFLGHGYVLRGSVGDAPKGIESIPPIFNAPLGSSLSPVDVYTIVMQINSTLHLGDFDDDSKTDISELIEPPRYIYDEKLNHTYYIKKLECRVFLALVYEGLKPHKDKQINEFIVMLGDTICLHKVICLLRQQQSSSSTSTDRRNLRSWFFN
ncbi:hypothetical protein MN116_005982 [Schistosoma mekongi]|uniref:Uncharacterized protein n=1 Tax=Schistosoma mekongi TaxID=38744 RepID=A0AAE2D432_SCHME|nr:hypothetical protein MN116_005982 [Schistosoma mekongi]